MFRKKKIMNHLTPTKIHTLGDYYKPPYLREDCHRVKENDAVTANDVAYHLAKKLPKDCILVPVPSLSGYNEAFTRMLAYYANAPISFCLQRALGYGSLYKMKKEGGMPITEEMTGIWCNGPAPKQKVVLVDNVIATGTTMSAAIRAIGKPCEAACIAVDYEQYNNNN